MLNVINNTRNKWFKKMLVLFFVEIVGSETLLTSVECFSNSSENTALATFGTWKYGSFWPYASNVTKLSKSTYRVYYSKNSCEDMASTVGLLGGVATKSKAIQLAIGAAVILLAHPKHGYRVDIHNPRSRASYNTNVYRWD